MMKKRGEKMKQKIRKKGEKWKIIVEKRLKN